MTSCYYLDTCLSPSLNDELLEVRDHLFLHHCTPGSNTDCDMKQVFINAGWVCGWGIVGGWLEGGRGEG